MALASVPKTSSRRSTISLVSLWLLQPPAIPQTFITAVAGSAVQHGIAVQLQFSSHTAGSRLLRSRRS